MNGLLRQCISSMGSRGEVVSSSNMIVALLCANGCASRVDGSKRDEALETIPDGRLG